MPLTPNNREEHWLQGMVDGQTTLEPNKRREYWYKEIVDAIGSGGGGGTGGGVLVVNDVNGTLDKTWKEIYDAITGGKICLIATNESGADILFVATSIATDNNTMYVVKVEDNMYTTNTEGGYPVKS